MKRCVLISVVFVLAGMLLVLAGCREPEGTDEPKITLTERRPGPNIPPVEPPDREPEPDTHGPKITFEKVVIDLGDIVPGSRNSCEFVFKNTGDARLKISRVQCCCGFRCILKDNKKEYAPGESGVMVVTFSTGRYAYQLTKYQHVYSNDKTNPDVMLTVKGNIVMKVKHSPPSLKLVLNRENAGCPALTLTSTDNQPFSIRSFNSKANCLTADFDSAKKDTKFVLHPKANLENLEKNPSGYIRVGLTHPQCDVITVPFEVLARFQLNPPSIIIRDGQPQKPVERYVWVLNNYEEDFEVESASSRSGMIEILSQEKLESRHSYKFRLRITPPASDGRKPASDMFSVKIKDGKELRVSCYVWYAKKAL